MKDKDLDNILEEFREECDGYAGMEEMKYIESFITKACKEYAKKKLEEAHKNFYKFLIQSRELKK